ncbi:flavin reductase family protein [Archaeoglobus veneficus]|uniref:Flavin reductase domain protein FMN-binding protein n=1 Tax=Archaeoglobus veneficus (strain DSM 11195 / SNP6) TaxID=693661 RepID=F2KQ09_ARCVS|nr:flavin reductase family protein [Archaeoglobus veneficus]AEA47612.1 flavin reductase domain protein FMN-binding protein [Archaeoglobus veneficus SNP6]
MLEYLYPIRTYLIVSGTEKPNVMTADWVVPLSFNPPMLGVAIGHSRYTHRLIKEHGEFVVAVPTLELLREVWMAGTISGAERDKCEILALTFVPSKKVSVPSIKECQANIECRVVKDVETGDHTFFVGEIVDASHGDAFRRGVDVESYRFILHAGFGRKFTTNTHEIYEP